MEFILYVLIGLVALAVGAAVGYSIRRTAGAEKVRAAQENAERIINEARAREREILLEAKDEAIRVRTATEAENKERRAELQRSERRVQQKEENLERKLESLERREQGIALREREAEEIRAEAEELRSRQFTELERISNLTATQAKELVIQAVEAEAREEANRRVREIEQEAKTEGERRARRIVATAIQRLASDVVSETTVSVVPLPNEEMKGRIIGREGRNIRALENATGVDLIIDDTPDAVTLSNFDPVRREVARVALTKLVADGRIHPTRIEEVVQEAKANMDALIREEGEQAAYKAGVHNLHPDLIRLLGRLKYRYSYGQNVLLHSIEVAHLAAMMATELGADVATARAGGLLHDIGKAVDHVVEGPHALIGGEIYRRLARQSPAVARAIAAHHGEEPMDTVEAVIVATADAISGGRPGARRESLDAYVKRLEALEEIATSFSGVEKAFAVQAGREVRIIVKPDEIDDTGAMRLARDIVHKIEDTLEYPGQIKVTVVRETRATEYAK